MIYLLVGNKKERRDFIKNLCSEKNISENSIHHLYDNSFKELSFQNLVPVNRGLFSETELFVFHECVRVLDIKNILKEYSETEHNLFLLEDSILKKDLTTFQKSEVTIHQFEKEQKNETKKYNTFALADLLGRRDKKNIWLGFREAITQVSAEEIHGILFWQIKNLALVKTSTTNPGMNPFVYKKNQSFVNNYSEGELKILSQKMTRMFHKRDSYSTLEIELEKFILEL